MTGNRGGSGSDLAKLMLMRTRQQMMIKVPSSRTKISHALKRFNLNPTPRSAAELGR